MEVTLPFWPRSIKTSAVMDNRLSEQSRRSEQRAQRCGAASAAARTWDHCVAGGSANRTADTGGFSPVSSLSNVASTRDFNNLDWASILGGVWWSEVREASWAYFRAYLSNGGLEPPSGKLWVGAGGLVRHFGSGSTLNSRWHALQ